MHLTRDGHSIEFRNWQEIVDEADFMLQSALASHSEDEEGVVEIWLEDPRSFQDADAMHNGAPVIRRVQAGKIISKSSVFNT